MDVLLPPSDCMSTMWSCLGKQQPMTSLSVDMGEYFGVIQESVGMMFVSINPVWVVYNTFYCYSMDPPVHEVLQIVQVK